MLFRGPLAAASRGFDRDQLVLHVVKLNQPWLYGFFFKMKRGRLQNICPEFVPSLALREDGMAQGAGEKIAFLLQQLYRGRVFALRRPLERRAALIVFQAALGAVLQQQVDDRIGRRVGRNHQGR